MTYCKVFSAYNGHMEGLEKIINKWVGDVSRGVREFNVTHVCTSANGMVVWVFYRKR